MTDPIFITSPVSVLTGDAARAALETTNDSAYMTPGKGVLSVPFERWQRAQQYERETWLTYGINETDSRNYEFAALLDGYKALPKKLGHVIELGCGPFTNWRIIQQGHVANEVILLDPLADDYQSQHPNCAYRLGGEIDNVYYPVRWVNSTIENYDRSETFDTVVIINVLSHCQDVNKVFDWINTHLKKGGYLVFGEPARDIDVMQVFDVGHPLSYNQSVIDDFLAAYRAKHRHENYFIGVKK